MNRLPLFVSPKIAAQKRLDYSGYYLQRELTRLNAFVSSINSDLYASISFKMDKQNRVLVDGYCSIDLGFICRFCNEKFVEKMNVNFQLTPVFEYAQIENYDEYEPVLLNEKAELDLLSAIEDELILALPMYSSHSQGGCTAKNNQNYVFGELAEDTKRENPFDVLAKLKK